MPVTISNPDVTKKSVVFTIRDLSDTGSYFHTINDVATDGEVAKGPVPAPAKGAKASKLDVATELADLSAGEYELRIFESDPSQRAAKPDADPIATKAFRFLPAPLTATPQPPSAVVRLDRSASEPTSDTVLWDLIQAVTEARQFRHYQSFVDRVLCRDAGSPFGPKAFETLVELTHAFLAGAKVPVVDTAGRLAAYSVNGTLPYLAGIVARYPDAVRGDPCSDIDPDLLEDPFPVELIWSYWHEEGSVVQTLNHILARFQNRRAGRGIDPLARFDLSPLRPLRSLLWSWAEEESSRLTVRRRAAEYAYEYGLELLGRAVPGSALYVERRTEFLEAFHTLLHVSHIFFQADDDATVTSDAFPVLNALRETHLVLAKGATNQFGDLPTQARAQMMVMQWFLAAPEMRDFLGGHPMVPYEEAWMDKVETMKTLQGWTDTSITYFRDLGVYGEQLLLSIRYGNWNSVIDPASAKNWARVWRSQIQRYVHAYRAVSGVDLSGRFDATMPSLLIARRVALQSRRA